MDEGGGDGCGTDATMAVGSKPAGASPYGALDMSGNVWEWTADWYDSGYYASSPSRNPTGPSSRLRSRQSGRQFRRYEAAYLRASYRYDNAPGYASCNLGFRCSVSGSP